MMHHARIAQRAFNTPLMVEPWLNCCADAGTSMVPKASPSSVWSFAKTTGFSLETVRAQKILGKIGTTSA